MTTPVEAASTQQAPNGTAGRRGSRGRAGLAPYLFVAPYVLLLVLFGVLPALYSILISFDDTFAPGLNFNGLHNYLVAVRDFRFAPAFGNVGLYLLIWLPFMTVVVLGLALLLHQRPGRLSTLARLVYFLPGAVTGSAAVVLWLFVLDPTVSPFGPALRMFGVGTLREAVDGRALAFSIALMAFSIGAGGWIVIMYGALQNIDRDLVEAATIDGCNAWQLAWHVKLPLIQKYVVYMLVLSFAGGTQLFVEPQLIGQAAGPGVVSPTWSPNLLAYDFAFNIGNFGAAAAISMLLLVVGLLGAYLLIFRTKFFEVS
ncbi:sugar ABC transporter permease [Actinopolymorpha sp. NPDC004070]|uniref:carbohydrate ABC transporter permease n=1 Tax=Actinopolymorpha sp. NPDC004070 TaxID=3154548 RepID=UPI0033A93493